MTAIPIAVYLLIAALAAVLAVGVWINYEPPKPGPYDQDAE